MTMNWTEKIIVVLLSLTFPIIAYTDYHYRPTPRGHIREANRNRFIVDSNMSAPVTEINRSPSTNNNKARQHGMCDDAPIVYPDPGLECPFGLCVNVAGYPKEKIETLLSRSQVNDGFFQVSEDSIFIDNRFNSDEMSLCETKVHTVYPEKANNTMKVEKVIVNVKDHQQGIVFETCVDNGKCKFSSNFPTGYTSFCKQKYIHRKLMVFSDNDKFGFDSFEVPSCCVCTVVRTD